jgi:hypothetical protein
MQFVRVACPTPKSLSVSTKNRTPAFDTVALCNRLLPIADVKGVFFLFTIGSILLRFNLKEVLRVTYDAYSTTLLYLLDMCLLTVLTKFIRTA